MSEEKNPREYWLLQHGGDAFIYQSLDEFPPDGDKSLLVHVREVIDETWQSDASVRKYEFTGETRQHGGVTLRQIRRISDGEIGGWIESEKNLSHEGDAWVSGNAKVYCNAWVSGNAKVYCNAQVRGNAIVCDIARVSNNAMVCGNAMVYGNAQVYGNAKVYGNAQVRGNAIVCDIARVSNNAIVCGNAIITGNDILSSNVQVFGCEDD